MFAFLILGEAIYRLAEVGMVTFSDAMSQEMNRGTLESLLTTRASPSVLILSSSIWPFLFALIRFGAYLVFGIFFFHLNLAKANVAGVLLVLLLALLVHAAVGILAAGVLLVTKRGNFVATLVNYLSWVFGGVYFPVTLFPESLRWVSDLFPLTYALDALRKLILEGVPLALVAKDCFVLLLFAAVLIPASLVIFHAGLWRVRVKGELAYY